MEDTKVTVYMNSELHRRFKVAVAQNGDTMRKVIEECVKRYVEETEKRQNER